jgi:hypothetical protein
MKFPDSCALVVVWSVLTVAAFLSGVIVCLLLLN